MNSPATIKMLLETVYEIRDTVSALNERSKNYFSHMETVDKTLTEHGSKIEQLEIGVAKLNLGPILNVINEHDSKMNGLEIDMTKIKQDRWWIVTLASACGGVVMFLLSKIF